MARKEVDVIYYAGHPRAFVVKPDFPMNILTTLLFIVIGAGVLVFSAWKLWQAT